MKPGKWFKMVKLAIGDEEYQNLLPVKPSKEESENNSSTTTATLVNEDADKNEDL